MHRMPPHHVIYHVLAHVTDVLVALRRKPFGPVAIAFQPKHGTPLRNLCVDFVLVDAIAVISGCRDGIERSEVGAREPHEDRSDCYQSHSDAKQYPHVDLIALARATMPLVLPWFRACRGIPCFAMLILLAIVPLAHVLLLPIRLIRKKKSARACHPRMHSEHVSTIAFVLEMCISDFLAIIAIGLHAL